MIKFAQIKKIRQKENTQQFLHGKVIMRQLQSYTQKNFRKHVEYTVILNLTLPRQGKSRPSFTELLGRWSYQFIKRKMSGDQIYEILHRSVGIKNLYEN